MTCPTCGSAVPADAHFCNHCGAQMASFTTPPSPPPPAPPPVSPPYGYVPPMPFYNRVATNIQALGILWAVYAGLRFLTGLAGLLFMHGFFSARMHQHWPGFDSGWSPFGNALGLALLPAALVSIILGLGLNALTAYALLTRKPWARVFAIIFSILALFHFPFGTLLGIYTLWVIAPSASGVEYAAISAQPRA